MIKKIVLSVFMLVAASQALAGPYHGHRHHQHRHWHGPSVHHWVVPALIGGAVVYAATRPDPVIIQQQPTVAVTNQYMVIDGVTYRKELMVINGISQEVWVRQ
jgi:hypothetical protein